MKCIRCGTEMNSTTGGNYTCHKCGQSVNDGVYRPPTNNIYGEPYLGWGQMGWICPKCGKVLAPWRAECDCHKKTTTTTDRSNITDKFDTPFKALFSAMSYIARLSSDQKEHLNKPMDKLCYIMSLYNKVPELVQNLCNVLPVSVEIVIKGPFVKPDLKQFIPDFPEDKIKISYTYENENLPA